MTGQSGSEGGAHLLTFGEAAELAGLALLDLRRLVREGRLATVTGWQFGHPVDLVRLEDLVRVVPAAGARKPDGPSLEERGIRLDPSGGAFVPQARMVHRPDARADDLRRQFKEARLRNEALVRELSETGEQMRGLLDRIEDVEGEPTLDLVLPPPPIPPSPPDVAYLQGRIRRLKGLALATGTLALLLAAAGPFLWGGDNRVQAAGPTGPEGPSLETSSSGPSPATRYAATADARPGRAGTSTDGAPSPLVDPPTPDDPAASDEMAAQDEAALPDDGVALVGGPRAERSDAAACVWFETTRRGADLRAVLGPCDGPWNDELAAVAGVHVFEGERHCRHHLSFARTFQGALARQRDLAEQCEAAGSLSPLMQLRLDRRAEELARDRTGGWLLSGFQALDDHAWTGAGDVWTLTSWVQRPEDAGRKRFTLELRVDDGPRGDHLLAFDWLD